MLRITLFLLLLSGTTTVYGGIEQGQSVYEQNCLACHMYDRRGVPGMAPSLVRSPWVIGSDEVLVGYLLTGGFGPDVLMARFDYLGNQELIDLTDYLRSLEGLPVTVLDEAGIEEIRVRMSQEGFYD
jgi:mono/diheme cytochrome c family protein